MTLTQWREIEKETETEKDILIFKRFQQLKDEQAILEKEINQYWIEFGDIVDSLLLQVDKDSPSTFSTEINKINSADISLLISAAKMVEQLIIHKVTVGEALTTFEMDARTIIRNIYKKLDKYGARLAEVISIFLYIHSFYNVESYLINTLNVFR